MSPEAKELLSLDMSERTLMRCFPPILAEIARIAGIETAIKIADVYGGRKLSIPADPESAWSNNAYVELLGLEKAKILSEKFANGFSTKIEIPNSLLGRTLTLMKALQMLENGASVSEVANRFRVVRKTVQLWKDKYLDAA